MSLIGKIQELKEMIEFIYKNCEKFNLSGRGNIKFDSLLWYENKVFGLAAGSYYDVKQFRYPLHFSNHFQTLMGFGGSRGFVKVNKFYYDLVVKTVEEIEEAGK